MFYQNMLLGPQITLLRQGGNLQFREELQGKLSHKVSVWQVILPDSLAGICHYTQCDGLQHEDKFYHS